MLGIGGMRALTALGYKPTVCHMNEGHSAFLSLERIRVLMEEEKLTFAEARELVSASNVFTTHTPVPAGNDAFHPDIIERYLGTYYPKLGLTRDEFFDLGEDHAGRSARAFRDDGAGAADGVALQRGVGSCTARCRGRCGTGSGRKCRRRRFRSRPITNGVHTQTWLSDEFSSLVPAVPGGQLGGPADELFDVGPRRPDTGFGTVAVARAAAGAPDGLHAGTAAHSVRPARASHRDEARIDEILDPEALTIGFARRFATYKRATLLFRNLERLLKLLTNRDRPVQFIFAGKSHPRDDGGKRFIQDIIRFCKREDVRTRMVFIEDYDMNVARYLVQGVDVWLNTPRRPMEASGTSGMKGPINGAINLSILDGWWVECYHNNPQSGWAIGTEQEYPNDEYQDHLDSESLFELLEKEVISGASTTAGRRSAAEMDRPHEAVDAVVLLVLQHQSHGAGVL